MLIEKDEPFEKSTPCEWTTAFPPKLSLPEGSTILLKLAKGVDAAAPETDKNLV